MPTRPCKGKPVGILSDIFFSYVSFTFLFTFLLRKRNERCPPSLVIFIKGIFILNDFAYVERPFSAHFQAPKINIYVVPFPDFTTSLLYISIQHLGIYSFLFATIVSLRVFEFLFGNLRSSSGSELSIGNSFSTSSESVSFE